MLYQTTQAHEDLRAKVREFAEAEIKPIAFMLDKENRFPAEAVKKMGELGLMGLPYGTEYEGAGSDALSYAIAVEELARVDGGVGVILSAHTSLGTYPIYAFGNEEQKKKYLPDLCSGRKIGAFGLTEPNAGSDAGGTETTAEDMGDHYLLNGEKIFITNGGEASTYVVFAVTTPGIGTRGISAFIVEKGWEGFTWARRDRASRSPCPPWTAGASASRPRPWASPRGPMRRRWSIPRTVSSLESPSASSRISPSKSPTWPPSSAAPASWSTAPPS